MTKLTQQEIEKERELFEEHLKSSMKNFVSSGGIKKLSNGKYKSITTQTWFFNWIKNKAAKHD